MAKAEEIGKRETQRNIPMHLGNLPRDLLQRFMPSSYHFSHTTGHEQEAAAEEEIELSLGLSLNGRFGVDPRAKKLKRSSSISEFMHNSTRRDSHEHAVFPMACGSLLRTCSLPIETEEEWRTRKELQSLRRMEAKRKRSEKQKNLKAERDRRRGGFGEENCEDDKGDQEGGTIAASQASIGSQGSGSSGISELENQPPQETRKCSDARSPTSVQLTAETEQKPVIIPGKIVTQKSEKLARVVSGIQPSEAAVGEKKRNIVEEMPCVSTTGDGPSGKKIEGFLYRYRKGEDVRIVCVCHGSFLSPAEFVKHAGGRDVEHPLRQIVVNPSFIF